MSKFKLMTEIKSTEDLKKVARAQAEALQKTGYQVAKETEVAKNTAYRFLNTDIDISLSNAIKICNSLGIKIYVEIDDPLK